jgi:chemotaxis protein methyltransferase CheR
VNGEIPLHVEWVLSVLKEKTGIDWRRKGITKGFLREVEELKEKGVLHSLDKLSWDSDTFQKIISHFTVPEGYFFRYSRQFEFLKKKVLPELLKNYKEINIGSVGAGRGEEAYSIAMTLEGIVPEWWNVRVIGLDLNKELVQRAKEGMFLKSSFREGIKDTMKMYIEEGKDGFYRVKEHILKKVNFYPFNIMEPSKEFFDFFHVLFFRNVLIYIAKEKIEKAVENALSMLKENGIIFFGHTDIMPDMKLKIEPIEHSMFIYRKKKIEEKKSEEKKLEETKAVKKELQVSEKIKEGVIYFNAGETEKAERIFKEILLSSNNPVARAGLAFVSLERGMIENALSYVEPVSTSDPLPEVYYLKGIICMNTKRFDKALEFLTKAVEKGGNLPQIRVAKALVHLHLKEPDKAGFELETAEKFLSEDLSFKTFLPSGGLTALKRYINDLKEVLK